MKILILQPMSDVIGGIYFVNKELLSMFHKEKIETQLLSIRKSGYYNEVEYPDFANHLVVNENEEWGIVRKKIILEEIMKLNIVKSLKLINERNAYKRKIIKDYQKTKQLIKEIGPDYIINCHYELLDAIPKEYLNNTIMHFHTTFNEIIKNKSYQKTFNKYKNKIYKFVWLTKATCEKAIDFGYTNSTFIYNPVRIKSKKIADVVSNKRMIYIGRISKEKRVSLLLKIFDNISKSIPEWELYIFGTGTLSQEDKKIVKKNKNIIFAGKTSEVKNEFLKSSINLNTSEYEGFSMTILEANECGVPTVTFNYGESVNEQIINNSTGIIVNQDDIEKYAFELKGIVNNPHKLKEMSLKCKEFNNKFTSDKILKEWLQLFEERE